MGTTLVERLFAQFAPLTGKFMRVIGGRRADGNAQAFLTNYKGSSFIEGAENVTDAFDRFRNGQPFGLWDAKQVFDNAPNFFATQLTGAGTATYLLNESSTRLSVTTASGDRVVRQSLTYIPYQPGRSQLIFMTGLMGAIKANVRQRIGYFDTNNGVFFEQNGSALRVVRRTFVSGAPVDNAVAQSAWNIDRLDGSGPPNNPSGITIDMTKVQVFVIDFAWLGAGRVRMGFLIGGRIVYCHEFLSANVLTTVWTTMPMLPVRWEIENTGASASPTDMLQICAAVFAEGGFDQIGITRAASTALPPTFPSRSFTNGTPTPVMSIRLKTAYNRAAFEATQYEFLSDQGQSALLELYRGGTLSGGTAVVTSVSDAVEMETGRNTLTGGVRIAALFLSSQARAASEVVESKRLVSSDIAGTPELMTMVITPFANLSGYGAMHWRELY